MEEFASSVETTPRGEVKRRQLHCAWHTFDDRRGGVKCSRLRSTRRWQVDGRERQVKAADQRFGANNGGGIESDPVHQSIRINSTVTGVLGLVDGELAL